MKVVVVGEDCAWKLWLEVGGRGCGRRSCLFEGHGWRLGRSFVKEI